MNDYVIKYEKFVLILLKANLRIYKILMGIDVQDWENFVLFILLKEIKFL